MSLLHPLLTIAFLSLATSWCHADKDTLRSRFAQGEEHLKHLQYKEALALFEQNLKDDPDSIGSLLYSAIALNELGRHKEAIPRFQTFLEKVPYDSRPLIGIIRAHQAMGNQQETANAIAALRKLKNENKDFRLNMMASFERDRTYLKKGGFISANEFFNEAPGRITWKFTTFTPSLVQQRTIELVQASEETTRDAREKNPAAVVYFLQERNEKNETLVYEIYTAKPAFENVRGKVFEIVEGNAKPIR